MSCFILMSVFFIACATQQQGSITAPQPDAQADIMPKTGAFEEKPTEAAEEKPIQEISPEVKELLDKHKTKVKSIYYKYKGPQTGDNFYDFYIKGAKIKYNPHLEIKTLDKPESYDAIFIDKEANTAASYCMAAYCTYKGKKQDLKYDDAYISTIIDWVSGLAYAEKVGEEVIDDRNTWKLDTNEGILWVDTFYGIPLKTEAGGKSYRFQQVSVNSVQDSDVVPS